MLRVNSKQVMPGDTFLALTGVEKDGHNYIEEAIDKGAACIIAERGEYSVKTIIVKDTRTYLINYLKELYLEKINKIKIIGIVGTSGKTTTGDLAYQILNKLDSKTAFIGTNGFYINDEIIKTSSTTPDIYDIYEMINKAIDNNCENIIIEVSSRSVIQRHIDGLRFDIILLTNFITEEIIDEDYLNSKIEVLKRLKKKGTAIINKNNKYIEYFTLSQNHNVYYGTKDSEYVISNVSLTYDYTEFNINDKKITLPLIGSDNLYDYLAAYIIAKELHFPDEAIINVTNTLKPTDGRYQNIKYKNSLIIVDYAYDLENIKNIIAKTKEFSKKRIILIVGSGGDRRKNQRNKLGEYVVKHCDYVIFTEDNPRYENPEDIVKEMTKGIEKENFEIIINRKEAIKKGIEMLEDEDILLILGKGHEDYQIINNDKLPYKDYNEVIKYTK